MSKRKAIPNKVRFEVFKRDSFTCQYCGRTVPEVTLEVDHIIPVSKGGTNEIFNLVTSCRECNSGKSNVELKDDAVIKKQKAQLDELNEKRVQVELMIKWREEIAKTTKKQVDYMSEYIKKLTGNDFTENGRQSARKLINRFGFPEVCKAMDIAFDNYYIGTYESCQIAFNKIGGICYNRKRQREENGD